MMLLTIIFVLLGLGMVLVIYGTIAKNKWGVNFDPVSCPRCNAPLRLMRRAQTVQQAMWGGGTCRACGAEVDKWGREVVSPGHPHPPGGVQSEGQIRRALRRRPFILAAVGFFCLTLLFDWLGVGPSKGGFPSTLVGWMVVVGAAAVEAAIFAILFYFAWTYLLGRFFLKETGGDPARGGRAD